MEMTKIILCGKRATGKSTLFWDLQKALNWPVFSISEFLRSYLYRHGLKKPEDIDAVSAQISQDFDTRVDALLRATDHVIIDARVFGKIRELLPNTLKVLLTASDETRLKRAAYREGTDVETQRKKLLKKEDAWIEKMHTMYPFDFFDPQYYNLVIDTDIKTPEEVLEIILSKMVK